MAGKRKSVSLNAYDILPKTSQRDAAAKLGIPQATLCSLLKQGETVMAAHKRRKWLCPGNAPVVEAAMTLGQGEGWVMSVQ